MHCRLKKNKKQNITKILLQYISLHYLTPIDTNMLHPAKFSVYHFEITRVNVSIETKMEYSFLLNHINERGKNIPLRLAIMLTINIRENLPSNYLSFRGVASMNC